MSNKSATVPRSFYYYDLVLMKDEDKHPVRLENQEDTFYEIFNYLNNKQEELKNGQIESDEISLPVQNGDKLYILVDKIERAQPIEFRMILCRADAFPLIENNGLLNFLTDYIPTECAIAEITHCVIFPKYNIMGAEYNFYGAKAGALKSYLPALYSGIDYVYCTNKLNDKIIDKLRKNETFSLFSISISNDSKTMTALMNSSSIFKNIIKPIDNVDNFEITLSRRNKKSKGGFESPMPIECMDDFINEYRDNIRKFKVSQGAIQGDVINLLHDKLVKTHNMTKTINKAIDSKEAYKIIKEFFDTTVKDSVKLKIIN